jgi:hypothetical protein
MYFQLINQQMSLFRKDHEEVRVKGKDGKRKDNILPPEEFTYGKPLKPSTPIKGVMSNIYGEEAEENLADKYQMQAEYVRTKAQN